MQSKRTELMSMLAKLALSFMIACTVFVGALGQAYANSDLSAAAQSNTHEIVCTCENCSQDEPDDTDIEEALKLIDDTDDAVVRPTPYEQG